MQFQVQISQKIHDAVNALNTANFSAYVAHLDELGGDLMKLVPKESQTKRDIWLKENCEKIIPKEKINLENTLAFCTFEEVWVDESLEKPTAPTVTTKYERHLSVKARLNRSTRRNINFAMRALALCVKGKIPEKPSQEKIKQYQEKIKQYNEEIVKAISNYRTKRQVVVSTLGSILNFLMAIVCGLTTGAAVIITLGPIWPLAAVYFLAGLVGIATVALNWVMFGNAIARVFMDIFGKDKLLEGWIYYNNEETGAKEKLSVGRRFGLAICVLLALSSGAAGAAITYSFVAGLGNVALFAMLSTAVLGGVFFPQLAVIAAAIFCLAISTLLINAMANFLRAPRLQDIIKRPFREVARVFDEKNERNIGKSPRQLKIEKAVTYTILSLLCGLGLFGLLAMQWKGASSLTLFLQNTFSVNTLLATKIAYVVSMVMGFAAQIPFTLQATALAVAEMARAGRNFVHQYKQHKFSSAKEKAQSTSNLILSFFIEAVKKTLKYGSFIISALGTGGLVLSAFRSLYLSIFASTASAWNSFAGVIAGDVSPEPEPVIARKKEASTARVQSVLKIQVEPANDKMSPQPTPQQAVNRQGQRYYQHIFSNSDITPEKGEALLAAVTETKNL